MSSDKLCGSCRYWGVAEDRDATFRRCTAIIHDERGRTDDPSLADAEWLSEEDRAEVRSLLAHKAVARDGDGYSASLRCRADFGCVLWLPCPKCGGTGVIETGNNDLPCDCLAGDKAVFNDAVLGRVTGKEIRAELLHNGKGERR